ncbi:MaoC/PaaZ C-terminal domain-containing protein [Streptomyces fuscichromogenes]|uniref:MaoC/PaaZ C-terminal domain-containing protein n=1 Tax=Streptomyces fuscichromogenes TaxID=1324013 RepID=UPI0037FE4677
MSSRTEKPDAMAAAGEAPLVDRLRPKIGSEVHVSGWLEVAQADIDDFSRITRDWDYMHNDPEWARTGPWGGTIAHGYFLVSLASHFMGDMGFPMVQTANERMLNYGLDRVRFVNPVLIGDRIRARLTLTDITERREGVNLVNIRAVYESERCGDQPHLIADVLMLLVHGEAVNEVR